MIDPVVCGPIGLVTVSLRLWRVNADSVRDEWRNSVCLRRLLPVLFFRANNTLSARAKSSIGYL